MHYGDYMLLRQHLLHQQQVLQKHLSGALQHPAQGASESGGKIQMVETKLYVGLNDADTKKQILETEEYLKQLKEICFTYHVPFSVGLEEGGYFHDNGEYVEEKTLVLTLIDARQDIIQKIAKDLRTLFHQESVLLTEDVIKGSYVS